MSINHLTTEAERDALHRHVLEIAEDRMYMVAVEIGSYQGGSSIAIASALKGSGWGRLYCIDLWDKHPKQNRYKTAESIFNKNIKAHELEAYIISMKMDSSEAAEKLSNNGMKYDFIFIDGDHSHAAVKLDFEAWVKLAQPDAVFAFHDCNPLVGYGKGPERLTQELIDSGKLVEIERVDSIRFLEFA